MPLRILGAGYGRTGTMSLKAALEYLGFGPCYHMVECMPRGPDHWKLWSNAVRGKPEWDTLFDGFGSALDFPACTSYRALAEYYPDAKVILTLRDPERWFASTQETIFSPDWIQHLRTTEMGTFLRATVEDHFDSRMHDREHLIRRFEEHADEVRATIPSSRLLEFHIAEGWGPLCEFLKAPVPAEDFPRTNDTAATQDVIRRLIQDGFDAVLGT